MRKLLMASAGAALLAAGAANAQPVKPVAAPGTIVVHLNGYLQFSFGAEGSSLNSVSSAAGSYKLNGVGTIGDFRFYPGFDAETVNGIDYGAQAEVRTGYSDASVGQNGKPITTSSADLSSLYVKRAYGYLGTYDYGFLRFGQTDSAFNLLQDGVVETFGDGAQWTGEGAVAILLPGNSVPAGGNQFIYADQTPVYATDKIVYVSPSLTENYLGGAFSAVVGYEPNSDGLKEGYANNSYATSTSAQLESSSSAGDIGKRRRNTFDGMIQYAVKYNGAAIKVSGGLLHGSPIAYTGATAISAAPYNYDSLNVYQFGGQVTYAGFTLGANLKGGQVEDGYTFKPKGARDGLAYMIDGTYVIGPYVLGVSYFNSQTSGSYVPGKAGVGKTLSEYGVAVGGNYVISKDLSLFAQYMYGHRHQPGVSFGPSGTAKTGNAQGQVLAAGATIKW